VDLAAVISYPQVGIFSVRTRNVSVGGMLVDPQDEVIVKSTVDLGHNLGLKVVAEGVQKLAGPDVAVVLITHYFKILEYLKPDVVHVLKAGSLVASGEADLAEQIQNTGFDSFGATDQTKKSSGLKTIKKKANPFMVLD